MASWSPTKGVYQGLSTDALEALERLAAHSGCPRTQVLDQLLRLPEAELLRHLRDQVAVSNAAGRVLQRTR
jgi:hypothetical protein